MADGTVEHQSALFEAMLEVVEKLPAEQCRHDRYGKEETLPAGYPTVSVRGQTAPGDNAVDMGMIHEVLPPGVQNADDAYFSAEMFRIIGKFNERFGNRTEKKIVHDLPVHGDQGIQFRGDGEDHMKIFNRKKIFTAGLDPFFFPQGLTFGAVPVSAGVIRYLQMSALVALVLMTAQGGGSASLDGAHDPQMIAGQLVGFSVNLTVLTENIRNLKSAGCSHPLSVDYEGCKPLPIVKTKIWVVFGAWSGRLFCLFLV